MGDDAWRKWEDDGGRSRPLTEVRDRRVSLCGAQVLDNAADLLVVSPRLADRDSLLPDIVSVLQ